MLALTGCASTDPAEPEQPLPSAVPIEILSPATVRLWALADIRLDPDLDYLTPRQRAMLRHLIDAAAEMDEIFWLQSYGDREDLLSRLQTREERRLATINYGPWDRYRGNRPFVEGVGPRPPGAALYPADMTREEFAATDLTGKQDSLTVVRRHPDGGLLIVPYRFAYRQPLERAARQLALAADYCDDPAFKRYLTLRARALITDDYEPSDRDWTGLRYNSIDLVIGPVDHYEDQLFGFKAAYAAWVLVRDRASSHQLDRVAAVLPQIRTDLPVAPMYRTEPVAPEMPPGAFDAVFLAGAANAGPKASVIEMPEDPVLRKSLGARRIYLRNVMHAQFDRIVRPTASATINEEQYGLVGFDAYFDNLLLAELGRALGPGQTVSGGSLQLALRERYPVIDDGLADVLGVFIQEWLRDHGQGDGLGDAGHLVTFTAAMLRDIRLGNGSSRAVASMVEFNYLKAFDAVTRDARTGRYHVNPGPMREALGALASQLLVIMGNGDYQAAGRLIDSMGETDPVLEKDLAALAPRVPVDLVLEQGTGVLGLE